MLRAERTSAAASFPPHHGREALSYSSRGILLLPLGEPRPFRACQAKAAAVGAAWRNPIQVATRAGAIGRSSGWVDRRAMTAAGSCERTLPHRPSESIDP